MNKTPEKISKKIIIQLIQNADNKIESLNKSLREYQKEHEISASVYFYLSQLKERILDTKYIVERFYSQLRSLQILDHKTLSKNSNGLSDFEKSYSLIDHLKLDFESLYLFGGIILDLFSVIVAHIGKFEKPEKISFGKLINKLQNGKDNILDDLWNSQKGDIIWLNTQIKLYRNKFIVHVEREWQRSMVYDLYAYNFRLFSSASPNRLPKKETHERIIELYSKQFDIPRDQFPNKDTRKLLEKLIHRIKEIDDLEVHRTISELVLEIGLSTPSFQYVVLRFFSFINSGLESVKLIINKNG